MGLSGLIQSCFSPRAPHLGTLQAGPAAASCLAHSSGQRCPHLFPFPAHSRFLSALSFLPCVLWERALGLCSPQTWTMLVMLQEPFVPWPTETSSGVRAQGPVFNVCVFNYFSPHRFLLGEELQVLSSPAAPVALVGQFTGCFPLSWGHVSLDCGSRSPLSGGASSPARRCSLPSSCPVCV